MCPRHLAEQMPRIDEQHLVLAGATFLALSRNHNVTGSVTVKNMFGPTATMQSTAPVSIELLAQLPLAAARIRRAVGHHEAGAAGRVQRGIEQVDPEVVRVVDGGQAEREPRVDLAGVLTSLPRRSTSDWLNGGLAMTKSNRPTSLCGSS